MKLKKSRIISLGVLTSVLFGLWWGVPTYKKTKADALVDELCAKDGGITVYETVKLPESRFDQYGNVHVPSQKYRKSDDDFYYTTENTWILRGAGDPNDLVIWRGHYVLHRGIDEKKVAESIYYARRGGDPPSPAHPSSHQCPENVSVEKKVFTRF